MKEASRMSKKIETLNHVMSAFFDLDREIYRIAAALEIVGNKDLSNALCDIAKKVLIGKEKLRIIANALDEELLTASCAIYEEPKEEVLKILLENLLIVLDELEGSGNEKIQERIKDVANGLLVNKKSLLGASLLLHKSMTMDEIVSKSLERGLI